MASERELDVAIVGAGHNGLVAAGYLARAGLSVALFERREIVGGAAVTEEFAPGFRNSTASYTVSLLHPKVIADLELAGHGLRVVARPMQNFLPLPDGNCLCVPHSAEAFAKEVARHSSRDAERLPAWQRYIREAADQLRSLALETPPTDLRRWPDLARLLRWGRNLRSLSLPQQRLLYELFTRSAGELLDHWFESDALKAMFGFDSITGTYGSPYTPGSAYVLLHHAFGEVNGQRGTWGHAIGGMGAITQAMARSAQTHGARIETGAAVARVLVRDGRASGIELENGRQIRARIVAANVNPKLLYLRLLERAHLPAELIDGMQRYRCGSASFRMNVALSELPRFSAAPRGADGAVGDTPAYLGSGIYIAPSLAYMDRAFATARLQGYSAAPVIEIMVPSTVDDSLAPPGAHVASLFCQHFAPQLPGARHWDEARDEAAALIIDTIDQYAPNFRRSVIASSALTPTDLEQRFGLVGGDIFHGALGLDQMWAARPLLGYGDYRTPIRALYLCGSGAHPGGGVSGLPGYNAARRILQDCSALHRFGARIRRRRSVTGGK
jgi:phytoene dehydrogenase-like protein